MPTNLIRPSPRGSIFGALRSWLDLFVRFARLAGPYWSSEDAWRVRALTTALIVLTAAQVGIAIAMNLWTERLFSALEQKALSRFFLQIALLAVIIAGNAAIAAAHMWVKRRIQIDWRGWLTRRLTDEWMTSGRHYQVTLIPGEHDNPDGRIAEDIRIAAEYAIDLGHSLFYCIVLLISFTQILWTLSGPPLVNFGAVHFYLPGHLVWIALLYAAGGTALAVLLGQPLVRAANSRQTAEANFRFGLVHARENSLAIALLRGERDERNRFISLFRGAIGAWSGQTTALVHILLFTASWSVLSQVFPVLVAAPRYIAGAITLGILMQTAQAFQQMVGALSWPIDNFAKAAEWRASAERVQGLHAALGSLTQQVLPSDRSTFSRVRNPEAALVFHDFSLAAPDGRVVIAGFDARIEAGERVLISGEPGATVNLFKAVVGLWHWGRGRIEVPSEVRIFIMPQRPYLPIGTLRNAVCYPMAAESCGDAAIGDSLRRVELGDLAARLDECATWDLELSAGEQQRLGFARLLLHRPSWILIQEAIDALDAAGEMEMLQLLRDEFPDATVITIGHRPPLDGYYQRIFTVVRAESGVALIAEANLSSPPS
jgi:putative ATP-binding cassette transporter